MVCCIRFTYTVLTKMKEAQSKSALHPGNKIVAMKRKDHGGPFALRISGQPDSQFITKTLAKIQANARRILDGPPILPGKAFIKNAGQVAWGDSNPVIVYAQIDLAVFLRRENV